MQYRTLGRTGVQVSVLVLGAMNFGKIGRTTQDDATAIVDAALEAGINLIDTADVYSNGQSEEMVGKAIAGRRDDFDCHPALRVVRLRKSRCDSNRDQAAARHSGRNQAI